MDAKNTGEMQERIPFQEDVNVNFFFPGAQRRELVDDILAALRDGVTFISLTGEEGTGKTMICRMAAKEIADNNLCVYVPENIESFGDVIGVILQSIGGKGEESGKEVTLLEQELLSFLKEEKKRLIVIFDHAEKMYLAMLERLRKLLDRMNSQEIHLQIILAGRKLLYENLEQLEICNFAEIEEVHFHLSALEQAETHAYLNHCAKLRSRELGKCMFSSEAARKIYALARGNLKVTNILAAKAIAAADAEESFVVRPKNVIITDEPALKDIGRFRFYGVLTLRMKRNWLLAGATIVLLIGILIVFSPGGDPQKEGRGSPDESDEVVILGLDGTEATDPIAKGMAEAINKEDGENRDETAGQEEDLFIVTSAEGGVEVDHAREDLAGAGVTDEQLENTSALSGNVREQAQDSRSQQTGPSTDVPAEAELDAAVGGDRKQSSSSDVAAGKNTVRDATGSGTIEVGSNGQLSQAQISTEKDPAGQAVLSQLKVKDRNDKTVGETGQVQQKKATHPPVDLEQAKSQPDKSTPEDSAESVEEKNSPVLSVSSKSVPLKVASIREPKQIHRIAPVTFSSQGPEKARQVPEKRDVDIAADSLYEQRLSAGKKLFGKERQHDQTIQLMALTAGQAEKNLQAKLTRPEYQAVVENLYIVESNDNSKIFVYYGHYPDEAAAQQARKALPLFLRENSPFVLSLSDVRRKMNLHQ